MSVRLCALIAFMVPSVGIAQEVRFGEWVSPNGAIITVEEDFMDARYPRHVIVMSSEGSTNRDGALVLRCEENVTEVFFVSGPFDFFGFGQEPSVNMRFPTDERASDAGTSPSVDGEAAFFPRPIEFIERLYAEGSVGLGGRYYSGSFRQNFIIDPEVAAAIEAMARTCEWSDRLADSQGADDVSSEIERQLVSLIEQYGFEAVQTGLKSLAEASDPPAVVERQTEKPSNAPSSGAPTVSTGSLTGVFR